MSPPLRIGGLSFGIPDQGLMPGVVRRRRPREHSDAWERDVPVALVNIAFARRLYGDAIPNRPFLTVLAETSVGEIPPLVKRQHLLGLELVACVMRGESGHWDLTARARFEVQRLGLEPTFDEREMRSLLRRCGC